ncbi:restriction endonuclease subunit S [Acinetobacter sp. GXMZU3951]
MKSVIVDGSYTHTLSIPDEWEFSELKNVINLVGGNQPPKSKFLYEEEEDTVRLIQIRDYKSDQHKVFIRKSDAKRFVEPTDVMIGRYGPPIFQILRGLKGAYNVALMKAEPVLGSFDKDYLYYYLSNQDLYNYVNSASDRTAGQSGVNKEHLEKYPVPVVPLAEQQEIVRQLDFMLAQVEQIKARLDAIPTILKKFRESVLADAVSGKLIVCKEKWKIVKLNDFVTSIEAGKNLSCIERPPVSDDEYGIVKISAVTWGKYNEEESKTLPEKSLFQESRRVKKGDLLLSRANTLELVGNPVIVHKTKKNLMLSDKVLRLVMSDHSKKWVNLFLKSKEGRNQIESRATGNQLSMRNISQKALMDIDIPQPSMDEQIQIGIQVDKFFEYAERIEQTIQSAQKRVNLLTQSILAKAFSGELTAEWREQHQDLITGVNSAEALLAKIQAEREASKPVKKIRAKKEA